MPSPSALTPIHAVETAAGSSGVATLLRLRLWVAAIFLSPLLVSAAPAPKLTPQELQFFESKIRPVLAENCYKCHSKGAEKLKGRLLLDTRDGVLKGGNTGPAVVPRDLSKSLLVTAVRYQDKDLQMPPSDKKLPDNVIADLEEWVRMGAPDPRTESATSESTYAVESEKARKHWAYKPITKPAVPRSEIASAWAQNPVDNFVAAGWVPKGLKASPRADKVTLIRRATFDLHGLPPTEQELKAFLADDSAQAWPALIDRLLQSPRYGERWGRFWLDLAKYADTRGPQNQGRDNRYLWSWAYRDWVIAAWNNDLPYDQFLLRQIAADKLNLPDHKDLAAMGFLTLGNRFGNNANDIIDDRIDLVGKSTMGLTLACARCHDHKFDPIPSRDYYSLHGIFSSSVEPREGPLLSEPKDSPAYREYQRVLASAEAALETFRDNVRRELGAEWRGQIAEYLLALHAFKQETNGVSRDSFMRRRKLDPRVATAWHDYLKTRSGRHHAIWTPWFSFAAVEEKDFTSKARELSARYLANGDKAKPINPNVAKLFVTPPANLSQVAARYESLFLSVSKTWETTLATYEARLKTASPPPERPTALPDKSLEELRQALYERKSPIDIDDKVVQDFINRNNRSRDAYNALQKAVNDVKVLHPGSPARAHALVDADNPKDSYVMLKGNPGSRGPTVPRQPPAIIATHRKPVQEGSGRLELAQAIVSPENPLTARVMINRLWLHHFGHGLVATPDDFGMRSEPPTHPELLDYLAARFRDDGWSIKSMHRLLMTSATYQQSSDENPRFAQIDPENRFYWQMNRRRLDFEALRDTILAIGGRLDTTMGGVGERLDAEPYPTRRTVYAFIDRTRVPNMFQTFDFANPDLTTGQRNESIIPQQALFMMNSPLVVEQARNLTLRSDFKGQPTTQAKIKLLYQLIYQRAPTEVELTLALNYVQSEYGVSTAKPGAMAWEYGYGEFNPAAKRVESFVQLPTFNNRAWVLGNRQARGRIGPVSLTATGGMPGNGAPHAAIRRWTARRDGFISVEGILSEQSKNPADAANGLIVSSGNGLLGSYSPRSAAVPTKLPRVPVKRGDTIDFVVSGTGAFNWAPTIRYLEAGKTPPGSEWNAEKDFSGAVAPKQMEAWEKFAQVLLETNEMAFIN